MGGGGKAEGWVGRAGMRESAADNVPASRLAECFLCVNVVVNRNRRCCSQWQKPFSVVRLNPERTGPDAFLIVQKIFKTLFGRRDTALIRRFPILGWFLRVLT